MEQKHAWYKLDNAAKIYPSAHSKNRTALFRLSATLREEIDTALLEKALAHLLKRLPVFSCRIRPGFFWYYLEQISGTPPIEPDVRNPMSHLVFRENRHFLFRVRYDRNRVSVEFFHAVTDGTGGLTFLVSLVAEYLRLKKGLSIPAGKYICSCLDPPDKAEAEDSFLKYARKERLSRRETPAYCPAGTALPLNQFLLVTGRVSTSRLLQAAKERNVTLGVFLTALLMAAYVRKQQEDPRRAQRKKPVRISVPVNLRQFYPTKTLRNFSSYVNPGIESRLGSYTFDEILSQVNYYMGMNITEKHLNGQITENVMTEKSWPVRLLPLFLKNPVIRLAVQLQGDRFVSSVLSNLGNITLPPELAAEIGHMDFMLGRPSGQRSACACLSYGGETVFSFSRTMDESDIERYFFTALVEMGIPVTVESNGRCE